MVFATFGAELEIEVEHRCVLNDIPIVVIPLWPIDHFGGFKSWYGPVKQVPYEFIAIMCSHFGIHYHGLSLAISLLEANW